ncbi:hypothetical protein [Campylobacter curvus]|uniref:hypothetical protein n=1 Tax=Campylobacter curvus TaxID=200 RepID=UPI0003745DC0|nr:hypothetical protein [Campylobacter curvus]QKF61369.1 hypothetical protein CCVT_1082 [Campylobacter curvus]UEB49682.1 hypothetical protein LK426_08690 [Campylobacter curvus]
MNEWIKDLKLALLNEDFDAIITLSDKFNESDFKNLEDMQEAQALLAQAKSFFENKSSHIQAELSKLQKAQKYIKN